MQPPTPSPAAVLVSVIVPARNEEATLAPLLDALLAQTRRPDEIVVADAGSVDGTAEVARRYGVRVLAVGPAWPGAARNAAIREARHAWVAMVDAGCRPQPSWLEELLAPLSADPGLDVVMGEHLPLLEREWDRIQALTIMPPLDERSSTHGPSTASLLLRRELWVRVGGFREDLRAAEDHLFFRALATTSSRTAWAPRAVVHWRMSPGVAAAFRRLVAYSEHHLRAGLFRTWHRRVMLMDAAAIGILLAAPLLAAVPVVAALLAARAFATARRRGGNLGARDWLTPSRLVGVAFLIVAADVAVWLGAARAALRRPTP